MKDLTCLLEARERTFRLWYSFSDSQIQKLFMENFQKSRSKKRVMNEIYDLISILRHLFKCKSEYNFFYRRSIKIK